MFRVVIILLIGFSLTSFGAERKLDKKDEEIIEQYNLLKVKADNGDLDAMLDAFLIVYYEHPLLEDKQSEAIDFIINAAVGGNVDAQYNMGYFHLNGEVFDKNLDYAIDWFEKAQANGHKKSFLMLGVTYRHKLHQSKKNYTLYQKSQHWLEKSALVGNVDGMRLYAIGVFKYEQSKASEAVKWLKKAAEQNDAESMRYLGIYYSLRFKHENKNQDFVDAEYWYKKAAELGDKKSIEWP